MARQGWRTVELHDLRVTVDLLSAARAFRIGTTAVHSIEDGWAGATASLRWPPSRGTTSRFSNWGPRWRQ